jgi:hypothetical protein
MVPPAAVLVREEHDAPVGGHAGRATGLGQQQQRQQPDRLGLVGHQLDQQAGQADGLGAQVLAYEIVAGRRGPR